MTCVPIAWSGCFHTVRQQTLLRTYLSAVLLVGLVLNATLGWSWADPIAALAAIAVKEGRDRDAWQAKGCCASPAPDALAQPVQAGDTKD